jgi:hypothetical protein
MMAMSEVPLPSWDDGPARSAIVDFVARVTKEGGWDYVPPAARIAAFDNDGTLWCAGGRSLRSAIPTAT